MVIKIEVHGYEKWLTTEWQQRHLAQNDPTKSTTQLIISSPEFHPDTDIHIFYEWAVLNDALYRRVPIEKRFGLLLESSANSEASAKSISHINQYRTIFTHNPSLLACHPNYHFNPHGMSWAYHEHDLIESPPKSKLTSMITSNLSNLPGHKLRLSIAKKIYEKGYPVDIFGRGISWGPYIEERRDGVAPYLFNIAIENCQSQNYFTEKLIDCFVVRTIPLYWGCPNIADFFNPKGMIIFHSEDEFWPLLKEITSDAKGIYFKRLAAVEENFRIALEKFNVRQAWGTVAESIIHIVRSGYLEHPVTIYDKFKLFWMQNVLLYEDHGFKRVVFSILSDHIRRFFPKHS